MGERSGGRVWRELDERLERIPVTPGCVDLLRELSLTADESGWVRPALRSLFRDEADPGLPDRFLGDLRELSAEFELSGFDRPRSESTLPGHERSAPSVTSPAGWFSEWVGVAQALGPYWTRVRPLLRDLARELPVVLEGTDHVLRPDLSLRTVVDLFDSLVEVESDRLEVPLPRATPPSSAAATEWGALIASVPPGPLGAAFRGRTISYPDGVDLCFDRFPTSGELRWGPLGTGLRFHTEELRTVPARIAACIDSYLVPARPLLETEGARFVARCERSFARFSTAFATELSERELAPSKPGRDGGR